MRSKLSTAAEILGVALIAAGLGMLAPWLGVTAAGVAVVTLAVLSDLDGGEHEHPGEPE